MLSNRQLQGDDVWYENEEEIALSVVAEDQIPVVNYNQLGELNDGHELSAADSAADVDGDARDDTERCSSRTAVSGDGLPPPHCVAASDSKTQYTIIIASCHSCVTRYFCHFAYNPQSAS